MQNSTGMTLASFKSSIKSEKTQLVLACIAVFCFPLKLAFAYSALVPLIIIWLFTTPIRTIRLPALFVPLLAFFAVAALSSFFGIDPAHSLSKFVSPLFFSIAILIYAELGKRCGSEKLLLATLSGQTFAALYTVLIGLLPPDTHRLFMGQVTESGQLAVQIPLAVGMTAWYCASECGLKRTVCRSSLARNAPMIVLAAINFVLASVVGLFQFFNLDERIGIVLASVLGLSMVCAVAYSAKPERRVSALLTSIVLPLLCAALLANLKRGPWLGVFVGLTVFFLMYARVLIVPLLAATAAVLIAFEPIRTRLALSAAHFFIYGGRNVIWKIGSELAVRFPLGIGYHNSPYLRNFSVAIPPQHNHFHNDLLNVLVETGWLGLGCYLWWIGTAVARALQSKTRGRIDVISCALGCALLSWQAAGLVEYNFGDSEVVQIVFLHIGALIALREVRQPVPMQQYAAVDAREAAIG